MPSLFDKSNPDGIYPALEQLETKLRLPKGFCEGLRKEDDWSFIIKLHALLEAALTTLLAAKTSQELHSVFSRLEMSQVDTGKVAFAKALGLLTREERRFISGLSKLRNDLVHSVEKITFNLKEHVSGLDSAQLDSFTRTFGLWTKESVPNLDILLGYAVEHPKTLIWETGVGLLGGVISMQIVTAEAERDRWFAASNGQDGWCESLRSVSRGSVHRAGTPRIRTGFELGFVYGCIPLRGHPDSLVVLLTRVTLPTFFIRIPRATLMASTRWRNIRRTAVRTN